MNSFSANWSARLERAVQSFQAHEKRNVWLFSLGLCVIVSALLGQDENWDAINYHYYNAYAFLNGRMGFDIAPANMQTWFNPALDIPVLWMTLHLPGPLVSAVLAAIGGVNVALVYWLARAIQVRPQGEGARFNAALVAMGSGLLAFWAPMFISELGTTFLDDAGSLLAIAALLLVVRSDFSVKGFALAGLCLGLALSVKLTNVNAVIAFTLASIVTLTVRGAWFAAVPRLFASGFAALVTFLPIGGAWMVFLYSRFGNPTFPIYNHIFRSPYYPPDSQLDIRFIPKGFFDALSYPFQTAIGLSPTAEAPFADSRLLILILLALAVIGLALTRRLPASEPRFERRKLLFVGSFLGVFLLFWLMSYGIERYAITAAQLTPLVILALLSRLSPGDALFRRRTLAVLGLLVVTSIPALWGRVWPGLDWFSFSIPQEARAENRLYVLYSNGAESFAALALPPSARLIRIHGNLMMDKGYKLAQDAKTAIDSHKGELRSLVNIAALDRLDDSHLTAFGLARADGACFDISSKVGTVRSCPLKRLPTP